LIDNRNAAPDRPAIGAAFISRNAGDKGLRTMSISREDRATLLALISENDQDRATKLSYLERSGSGSINEIVGFFRQTRASFISFLVDNINEMNGSTESFLEHRAELYLEDQVTRSAAAITFIDSFARSIGYSYIVGRLVEAELEEENEYENEKGKNDGE
jgi:hypothetical protein